MSRVRAKTMVFSPAATALRDEVQKTKYAGGDWFKEAYIVKVE